MGNGGTPPAHLSLSYLSDPSWWLQFKWSQPPPRAPEWLFDTYNHYNRDDGVEPVKAMLLTVAQRIRPVLLTAIVTAGGVIPMALNIEFDFIRREIVAGGLSGSWFTHLSAALVSGLLFSTLLTLVMVPVMITAPTVIKRRAVAQWTWVKSKLRRKDVMVVAKPAEEQEIHGEIVTMRTAAE